MPGVGGDAGMAACCVQEGRHGMSPRREYGRPAPVRPLAERGNDALRDGLGERVVWIGDRGLVPHDLWSAEAAIGYPPVLGWGAAATHRPRDGVAGFRKAGPVSFRKRRETPVIAGPLTGVGAPQPAEINHA